MQTCKVRPCLGSSLAESKNLPALQTTHPKPKMKNTMSLELLGGGMSKVDRYKWTMKNTKGTFLEIPKNMLLVDASYQRSIRQDGNIAKMTSDWNWISCGTLTVADRNGVFYVIDGQHRKLAADRRSDIKDLPCMVFASTDHKCEAEAFVDVNQHRASVKRVDQFRASVVCDDVDAIYLNETIKNAGMSVSSSGSKGVIGCIGALAEMVKQDRSEFDLVFPLLRAMHSETEIYAVVAKGVWGVAMEMKASGKHITSEPTNSKLIRIGGKAVRSEIQRLSIECGKSGNTVFKMAVLKCLKMKI